MNKIVVITNLYPTANSPHKGLFVQRMVKHLMNSFSVEKVILTDTLSAKLKLLKALDYVYFYVRAFFATIALRQDSCVYVHYISHSSLPVIFSFYLRRIFFVDTLVVLNIHGGDVKKHQHENKFIASIKMFISKLSCRIANKIIVPSEYYKRFIIDSGCCRNSDADKVVSIPSGGVSKDFFIERESNDFRKSSNKFSLLYLSRFEKVKRPFLVFNEIDHALKQPNFPLDKITFCGYGKLANEVKRRLVGYSEHFSNVVFMDNGNIESTKKLFSVNDFFILLSESESLGLAPLEAMASGCIPILSDIEAFNEYIIQGVNGYIINSNTRLTDVLTEFSNLSYVDREKIRQQAIDTVSENYSKEVVMSKLTDLFNSVFELKESS